MALRQTSAPPAAQSMSNLNLPPPQTFDILPVLHELLARIDHTSTELGGINGQTDILESGNDIGALYTDVAPLEPKELPTEVLQVKAKIRNALKELQKLPDMDRSVEDQQMEIGELEERIAKQKAMLRKLGEAAKSSEGRLG